MGSAQQVELDAAKLLQKLIQESTDEPAKLATKLYVICQHMKLSGKEHSLPYQVISRAMETVIKQHGLDVNVLRSSRPPLNCGPQKGGIGQGASVLFKETSDSQLATGQSDVPHRGNASGIWQGASSSQTKEEAYNSAFHNMGMLNAAKAGSNEVDVTSHELLFSGKPPVGLSRVDSIPFDAHQGSISHRSGKSSEQDSPASVPMDDTRSANSQERQDSLKSDYQTNKKAPKKACNKRKRDSKAASDAHSDNPQQSDNISTGSNSRKGRQTKGGLQGHLPGKFDDHTQLNSVHRPIGGPPAARAKQEEGHSFSERTLEEVKNSNPFTASPKLHDDGEVSSGQSAVGLNKVQLLPRSNVLGPSSIWSQNRFASPVSRSSTPGCMEPPLMSSVSPYQVNDLKGINLGSNDSSKNISFPSNLLHGTGNANVGATSAFSSFSVTKMGFPFPVRHSNISLQNQYAVSKLQNENYMGSSSDTQFPDKGADLNTVNVSAECSVVHSKVADGITYIPQKMSEATVSSSLNASEASVAASGKAMLQAGSIPEKQNMDIVSVERSNDSFSKLKSGSNSELSGNMQTAASRSLASTFSSTPFKEQQLRQLRAQCLVFLAFRNNLVPRKLHLEIALGGNYPQEGGAQKMLNDYKGADTSTKQPVDCHESSRMFPRANDSNQGTTFPSSTARIVEENKHQSVFVQTSDSELKTRELSESYAAINLPQKSDSFGYSGKSVHGGHPGGEATESIQQFTQKIMMKSAVCMDKSICIEETDRFKTQNYNETFDESQMIILANQKSGQLENYSGDDNYNTNRSFNKDFPMVAGASASDRSHSLPVMELPAPIICRDGDDIKNLVNPLKKVELFFAGAPNERPPTASDSSLRIQSDDIHAGDDVLDDQRVSVLQKVDVNGQYTFGGLQILTSDDVMKYSNPVSLEYFEEEEGYDSPCNEISSSPAKYTTTEKWILDYQKKKFADEQKWALKQKKAEEMITACYTKLKLLGLSSTNRCSSRLQLKGDLLEKVAEFNIGPLGRLEMSVEKNEESGSPGWGGSLFLQTTEEVAKVVTYAASSSTVRSPRPSVIYSSKEDNSSSQLQKLQRHVARVLKGFSPPPETKKGAYNPEILTSQKRQWARFQLQTLDHKAVKEPTRLFESMVVVGLHPDADRMALEKLALKKKGSSTKMVTNMLTSDGDEVGINVEPQVNDSLFIHFGTESDSVGEMAEWFKA
ncbi:hypothetical protein HPP92_007983 [Vanilla planifolia]|uniref:QLQ domain-containing protein n=1 Tax=Vanilla planifolia TaxID=51239 RepID=A0A835V8B1_VANPL|nr:hypothetical protein HPP92_007983 [Vanilla planifolia]